MSKTFIPEKYKSPLGLYKTQRAISFIKQTFQRLLSERLLLLRVSAPLFVESGLGLNDDLNGYERPVSFDIPDAGANGQVVHSLAKWKRMALLEYGFPTYGGLYTDMNAIRRDEELDNLHSVYVDQWDWERIITNEDRNPEYLKSIVRDIVSVIYETSVLLKKEFPELIAEVCPTVSFITTEELLQLYPNLSAEEREYEYTKKHKTAFVMQIGDKLSDGKPHGGRAPDYDDWSLNGDILLYNEETLKRFLDSAKKTITILASENAYKKLLPMAADHNLVLLAPHSVWSVGGVTFYSVHAEHSDRSAVGFIIDDGKKTYYVSGDTLYNYDVIDDVLDLVEDGVDYAFLPINGRGNNMNAKDAADFAYEIGAKNAIPMHYGLVDDVDPESFDFDDRIILTPYEPTEL